MILRESDIVIHATQPERLSLGDSVISTTAMGDAEARGGSAMTDEQELHVVHFPNANSRHTYFTVHNIRAAQAVSTGVGIKVAILDHEFGVNQHPSLYSAAEDFVDRSGSLREVEGHGYWMACVLKEIAPDCQILALNVAHQESGLFSKAIVKAVEWAVENGVNVITCSHGKYAYDGFRGEVDAAVSEAVKRGVATCFLHYDGTDNILPYGIYPYINNAYSRHPDINIWQYDYNTLFIKQYRKYRENQGPLHSGNDIPYFSASSTAAVAGGFVAILMALRPNLPPMLYKEALVKTSYRWSYVGEATFERGETPHVVDMARAVQWLQECSNV